MKETTTIEKPHLVENYVQSLMADHVENNGSITFPKVLFKHYRLWVSFFLISSSAEQTHVEKTTRNKTATDLFSDAVTASVTARCL